MRNQNYRKVSTLANIKKTLKKLKKIRIRMVFRLMA